MQYSEKLRDHFINPRNVLTVEEEDYQASGVGEVGSLVCGDMMKIWIRVEDDAISDLKWKTYGCAAAIGSTSMLSEMVIGKKLDDALAVTPEDVVEALGGLPAPKVHCSVLGDKALRNAIHDHFRRSGQEDRIETAGTRVVCDCYSVTEKTIEEAVAAGAKDIESLVEQTGASTGCGGCREKVEGLLARFIFRYHGEDAH